MVYEVVYVDLKVNDSSAGDGSDEDRCDPLAMSSIAKVLAVPQQTSKSPPESPCLTEVN
jgi:hypothetical protein